MSELSPATQAVLDAFGNASDGEYVDGVWVVNERAMLAAALCAVADRVVPQCDQPLYADDFTHGVWFARDDVRDDLLRIANELGDQ